MRSFFTKRVFVGIFIVLIISALLAGCLSPIAPTPVAPASEKWMTLLGEQWIEDVAWFLKINYVETEEVAWFGQYSISALHPNLYTTHQAISLFRNAGESIENPEGIVRWINSIQQEDGSFVCPSDPPEHAPPLFEVYWAVAGLHHLGSSPKHPERIADFVLSLQAEDGGFYLWSEDKHKAGEVGHHVATGYAVEILLILGHNKAEEPLRQAAEFLRQHLDSRLQEQRELEPCARKKIEKLENVRILYHLLKLTPDYTLPERYVLVLEEAVELALDEGFIAESFFWPGLNFAEMINQFMALAEMGVDINLNLDQVRQLTVTEVFPRLPEEGAHLFQGIIDPNLLTINHLVKLAKNVGVSYPDLETIICKVNRYRIEGGWLTFVHLGSSIRNTYAALYVASEIGYDQFDREKLKNFVLGFMKDDDGSLAESYYALRSLKLLEERPDRELIHDFKQRISQRPLDEPVDYRCSREAIYLALDEVACLAWLARELDLDVPAPVQAKADDILQLVHTELRDSPLLGMHILHAIALTQTIAGKKIFPSEELRGYLEALWSPTGGFKGIAHFTGHSPSDSPADIPEIPVTVATYMATEIMSILPDTNVVTASREEKMKSYILQSKTRFGFCYVSPDVHAKYDVSLETTWESTMAALKVLTFIEK